MPRPEDEGKCRSCGEVIVWCQLVSGEDSRAHPLNAVPSDKGTIETKPGTISGRRYGRIVPEAERGGRKLYVSHFATCPQAGSWRRR